METPIEEKQFDAARHFSEQHSSVYDEKIRKVIPGYQVIHELVRYLLEDNLPSTAKVLIAGTGTGQEILAYSKNNPEWLLVGFDPTESMLSVAKQKVQNGSLEKRVKLIQGFIHDVDESGFDAATTILVMQFLPDNGAKQQYLNEISSRLKSSAKLILVDLEGDKESVEYKLFISAWKAHQLSTREDEQQVIEDFEHIDRDVQFVPQHRIETLLDKAEFSNIQKFYKAYLFGGYIATKK